MPKYYSDAEMHDLRVTFESYVLRWPEVRTKMMFGCPSYQARQTLFSFLVTGGLVLTNLEQDDRDRLSAEHCAVPFLAGTKAVSRWLKVPLRGKDDLDRILPLVEKSFRSARREGRDAGVGSRKKKRRT